MSPHRIADAARISPYPSSIRAQEQERPDASTSQGSGSGSPSKARQASSRPRTERPTARQEEDLRFNIGPCNIRNLMSRRNVRTGRSGRGILEGIDEVVPNYPPPSFQEAIGTQLLSPSAAGPSALPGSLDIPGEHQHDVSESEDSFSHPESRGSPSETPSASESEDSLEIIDTTHPPGLSTMNQDDRDGHYGIEFPSPSPSPVAPVYVNTGISPSSEGLSRGRAKSKLQSVLDLTDDMSTPESETTPVRSTKKRFLSLSPLRTLFPPRHQALQARALSAHPSPGSSPYSTPRSTHFFRSTTSLATSSVLRLPFTGSTLTLTANKPESVKSRFFHSKEKEKEPDNYPSESLESWEFLEDEEQYPRSLMSLITQGPHSTSSMASPVSTTRSMSFTYGALKSQPSPASPTSSVQQPSGNRIEAIQPATQSSNEPHPLSLRDKKAAEAIEPFLRRRPRKDGAQRSRPSPIAAVAPSPGAPVVTTVRTRVNPTEVVPPSIRRSTLIQGRLETISSEEENDARMVGGGKDFQRALDTPLPSSPLQTSMMKTASRSSSSLTISLSSPTTPMPARGRMVLKEGGETTVQPSPSVPTPKLAALSDTPVPKPNPIGCACNHHSIATAFAMRSINNTSSSTLQIEASMSPSNRRHYHGRPLPRPPQPRNVIVDSIYAGNEGFPSYPQHGPSASCPEGLLIDLENDADSLLGGSSTTPIDDHQAHHPTSAPMTPNRTSPIASSTSTPSPSVRSLPLSFSSANASSLSGLSEMTDLDLLAAAVGEGDSNADYETLVLISDFLGPADAARANVNAMVSGSVDEPNVSLTGRVEIQRRRVTEDGRVKLKLSVLGVTVNKCGICLSQFRDGQHASMSMACRHVFHENCLGQWLVRSKTCPLCRITLDSGNR